MRSPEEFDLIRASNRSALGLAGPGPSTPHAVPLGVSGLGDGFFGAALGAAGPIRVSSEFPDVAVEWDPSKPSESPQQEGSGFGWWLTTRVVRPRFEGAGVVYAPGDGYPNYAPYARALAWLAAIAGAVGAAWVGWRAFGPRRRANPSAGRRWTSAPCRHRTRYYVSRSAA